MNECAIKAMLESLNKGSKNDFLKEVYGEIRLQTLAMTDEARTIMETFDKDKTFSKEEVIGIIKNSGASLAARFYGKTFGIPEHITNSILINLTKNISSDKNDMINKIRNMQKSAENSMEKEIDELSRIMNLINEILTPSLPSVSKPKEEVKDNKPKVKVNTENTDNTDSNTEEKK